MKCTIHPETDALAVCEICAKSYCTECLAPVNEHSFCRKCRMRPDFFEISGVGQGLCKPGTAFFLGLIPGVGAICNGEYIKALVHVLIFGFLISIQNSVHVGTFEPLFGMLAGAFYFYMPVEAYQTAKRKILEAHGLELPHPPVAPAAANLWAGIILTTMGIILFLNTIHRGLIEQVLRFWPVVLIGFGFYSLRSYFIRPEKGEEKI
jgi:hypothetical protein